MDAWWHQIWGALREEFSDLPDLALATHIIVRLLVAAVLGGMLGFERQRSGKAAGLRTHMLVALGAALFVLIPENSGVPPADMTRVVQGVVTGVGFLGAGAILKRSDEGHIEGLTTAASIWLTAAIGIAAGMGRQSSAILSAVLALVILAVVPHLVELPRADIPRPSPPKKGQDPDR